MSASGSRWVCPAAQVPQNGGCFDGLGPFTNIQDIQARCRARPVRAPARAPPRRARAGRAPPSGSCGFCRPALRLHARVAPTACMPGRPAAEMQLECSQNISHARLPHTRRCGSFGGCLPRSVRDWYVMHVLSAWVLVLVRVYNPIAAPLAVAPPARVANQPLRVPARSLCARRGKHREPRARARTM